MEISDFQKTIIQAMIENKVSDMQSLINEFCPFDRIKSGENLSNDTITIGQDENVIAPKDINDCFTKLKEYVAITEYLEKKGLVKCINKHFDKVLPIYYGTKKPNYSIIEFTAEYNTSVYAFPEVSKYVDRGYLTYGHLEKPRFKKKSPRAPTIFVEPLSSKPVFPSRCPPLPA